MTWQVNEVQTILLHSYSRLLVEQLFSCKHKYDSFEVYLILFSLVRLVLPNIL